MPDDQTNPEGPLSVKEARANYDKRKKQRARARRAWVKAKHRARKAKHRVEKAIDRREKNKAKHSENAIRDRIVDYAMWGVQNEPSIHYQQSRPYPSNSRALPMYTDCSGFVTLACKDAGAQDPNGTSYNGYGFTGTLYNHCPKISEGAVKVGDFLEHNGYPGSHVNVVVDVGSTITVVSHGQESGPRIYPASVEIAAHGGSAVWLKTV